MPGLNDILVADILAGPASTRPAVTSGATAGVPVNEGLASVMTAPDAGDAPLVNLSQGDFIIPADVVARLGEDGGTARGFSILQDMERQLTGTQGEPIIGEGGPREDNIPAVIDGHTPAAVSNGEYKLSANTVQALGGGDIEEGSRILDEMIAEVRGGQSGPEAAAEEFEYADGGSVLPTQRPDLSIDYDFIGELEGKGVSRGYVPDPENSKSGVTVGTGVDLGARGLQDLKNMQLSDPLIEKLKPYLGKQKQEAVDYLSEKPLNLTKSEVKELDESVKANINARLHKLYDKHSEDKSFTDLTPEQQTTVGSLFYQLGYRPKHKWWKYATKQDWKALEKELRNFGKNHKYPTRRNKEADYLTKK